MYQAVIIQMKLCDCPPPRQH